MCEREAVDFCVHEDDRLAPASRCIWALAIFFFLGDTGHIELAWLTGSGLWHAVVADHRKYSLRSEI